MATTLFTAAIIVDLVVESHCSSTNHYLYNYILLALKWLKFEAAAWARHRSLITRAFRIDARHFLQAWRHPDVPQSQCSNLALWKSFDQVR